METADAAVGKAARNEGRKLGASFLNTLAAAFVLAGLLQPALALVQQVRPLAVVELVASIIFYLLGAILFVLAQVVVGLVED